jgi:hypothetical protein
MEISSLPLPPPLVQLQHFYPLCFVLVFSLLFIVQFFCLFFSGDVSLPRGLCWFIPGVAGGGCSPVWSVECLPGRFGACDWWWWQPSCVLSWMWHVEALYGLGVQGVKVLILFGALFPPIVGLVSQQCFWFMELTLSVLYPSRHLGSLYTVSVFKWEKYSLQQK